MKKYFKRDINSLEPIFKTIHQFAEKNKLSEKIIFALNLATEEIFTNMIKYNSKNLNDVLIELNNDHHKVTVTFTDFDAEPFDIKNVERYNTTLDLDQRPIGKVGIHLVKKIIDEIKYDYKDRKSKLTLVKYVREEDV